MVGMMVPPMHYPMMQFLVLFCTKTFLRRQISKLSIKPGTWNIPEHRIIVIIMRKICKINFSKIKLNKNKPVTVWKRKENRQTNK